MKQVEGRLDNDQMPSVQSSVGGEELVCSAARTGSLRRVHLKAGASVVACLVTATPYSA